MKKAALLYFIVFSICILGQSSRSNNWNGRTTQIFIDSAYILKETQTLDGTDYNYKRSYTKKNFIEYGNVTTEGKATGQWFYINARGSRFIQGQAEKGYKIDKWTSPSGTFYIYKWAKDKTKTELVEGKLVRPKSSMRKGLMAK